MKKIILINCILVLSIFFAVNGNLAKVQAESAEKYNIDEHNAKEILEEGASGNYNTLVGQEPITSVNVENKFYAIIGKGVELVLSFVGIILIILIIYAGYLWFSADGNEEKISQAKSYIINAIIGIAIVFLAYAITYYVMGRISGTISNL
ncbi:MAG: hypothetical protein V1891_03040 [bacterium]